MMALRKAICILLLMSISSGLRCLSKTWVYLWIPRSSDVGAPGKSDNALLRRLLQLATTQEYKVRDGDSVDFIIRKQFLVSQHYKNAYALYFQRVCVLNQGLCPEGKINAGDTLRLPTGPKFGATELGDVLEGSTQDSAFFRLSTKAYGLGIASRLKVRKLANKSLAAYVTPSGTASDETLFKRILNRGLVYPVNIRKHPESKLSQTQALEITVDDEESKNAFKEVVQISPEQVLPGLFPVSEPIDVQCPQNCVACSTLAVPPGTDLTRARVLVEDTGIMDGLADDSHKLLYKGNDGKDDDGRDLSSNLHGTFVYSQIAAPDSAGAKLFGLIPKSQVYVFKAVPPSTAQQDFTMERIVNGWIKFSEKLMNDHTAAATKVVNVSAFGEPTADLNFIPRIPVNDSGLLVVAAAGNNKSGGTEDAPRLNVFPRLSTGSLAPLLIAGALGVDGKPAHYSNFNDTFVQLFAPGDCVCGAPGQINGTSQATPFVTTAAAVLASARPDWKPLRVMWRLISTADHPSFLKGKAFAGTINLPRALDKLIIIEANDSVTPHRATSIVYDTVWKDVFTKRQLNMVDKEILRFYDPQQSTTAGITSVCFSVIQNLLVGHVDPVCVDAKAKITVTENGKAVSFPADQIKDMIIPLRSPGQTVPQLPDVTVQ